MLKLPSHLYAANRELKEQLRNNIHGVTESQLRGNNTKIGMLTDGDYRTLIDYALQTSTIWVHRTINGLVYALEQLPRTKVVYDPSNAESKMPTSSDATPTGAKRRRIVQSPHPMFYHSHKPPSKLDVRLHEPEVVGIPVEYRTVALEIVAIIYYSTTGYTLSEIARRVPSFDQLLPTERVLLAEQLEETSPSIRFVDCVGVKYRQNGTRILMHTRHMPVTLLEHIGVVNNEPSQTPMAEQLAVCLPQLQLNLGLMPVEEKIEHTEQKIEKLEAQLNELKTTLNILKNLD